VVGAGVLLDDVESLSFGLEAVASAAAAGEAGRVDHAVVGEHRGGIAVLGCGFAEGVEHDASGDPVVRGDVQGVAGVVVEPVEDLDIGAVGESPVGEVGLPALVWLGGLETPVGGSRAFPWVLG
jgi:hypothetical protein